MAARPASTVALVALFALSGCASTPGAKPEWASAADVDFAALSTFGWMDAGQEPPGGILDSQIRAAVRGALLQNGYVEVAEDADFLVQHEAVEREAQTRSNPVTIGIGMGTWGRNVGGSVGTSVGVGGQGQLLRQNRVAVRAVAPQTGRELWTGLSATLPERPEASEVNAAVTALMRGFPARK